MSFGAKTGFGLLGWISFLNVAQAAIMFDLPIAYTRPVIRWMEYFQSHPDGRQWFLKSWIQAGRYIHLIQQKLAQNGLPKDLVYVVMVESGFNPQAISPKKAVGLWQFIEPTAKRYGLRINDYVDERMDPIRSTEAAIGYLRDLYRQFGHWHLALAAYNMGENGLERLILKHGTRDFWKLAQKPDFPKETSEYVPKILACNLLSKAPGLYGLWIPSVEPPLAFESLFLPHEVHLTRLAQKLDIFESILKELNPHLKKGIKPAQGNIAVYVPQGTPKDLILSFNTDEIISP